MRGAGGGGSQLEVIYFLVALSALLSSVSTAKRGKSITGRGVKGPRLVGRGPLDSLKHAQARVCEEDKASTGGRWKRSSWVCLGRSVSVCVPFPHSYFMCAVACWGLACHGAGWGSPEIQSQELVGGIEKMISSLGWMIAVAALNERLLWNESNVIKNLLLLLFAVFFIEYCGAHRSWIWVNFVPQDPKQTKRPFRTSPIMHI